MKIIYALGSVLLASALAGAQTPEPKLEFEVAAVKPADAQGPNGAVSLGLRMDGSQARVALPLRELIAMAYRVKTYQVVGPDWLSNLRFDINAKLPAGSTADQVPRMLQSLLADRFGLKFHREPKEIPVYALMVGKPPLKLKESVIDPNAPVQTGAVAISASGSSAGVNVNLGNGSSYTFAGGKFEGTKIDGRYMADMLERYTDRPVLDLTDLKGTYDFTFQVTPEEYQTLLIRAAVNSGVTLPPVALRMLDNGGDPLGEAVTQLGLKLDSRKSPVQMLVVDQMLKTPTDN
jgi:uncharacterized protein (TIGR03435 family)